jgi:hypothetical protein
MDLLKYWKQQHDLWRKDPQKFKENLKTLQCELDSSHEFCDFAPLYLAGNWKETKGKIFIGSLNPSANICNERGKHFIKYENEQTGFTYKPGERSHYGWETRKNFEFILFENMRENNLRLGYYTSYATMLSMVFKGYNDKYQLLHDKAVFGEIIPYYSKSFSIGKGASRETLEFYFNMLREFIIKNDFKCFILNGVNAYKKFIDEGFFNKHEIIAKVTFRGNSTNVYKVNIDSKKDGFIIPFINGLDNSSKKKIAGLIKKYF